jgi:hypothetical protein
MTLYLRSDYGSPSRHCGHTLMTVSMSLLEKSRQQAAWPNRSSPFSNGHAKSEPRLARFRIFVLGCLFLSGPPSSSLSEVAFLSCSVCFRFPVFAEVLLCWVILLWLLVRSVPCVRYEQVSDVGINPYSNSMLNLTLSASIRFTACKVELSGSVGGGLIAGVFWSDGSCFVVLESRIGRLVFLLIHLSIIFNHECSSDTRKALDICGASYRLSHRDGLSIVASPVQRCSIRHSTRPATLSCFDPTSSGSGMIRAMRRSCSASIGGPTRQENWVVELSMS